MKRLCCVLMLLLHAASTFAADSEKVKMRITMFSGTHEETHWDLNAAFGESSSIDDRQFKNYDQICSPDGVSKIQLKVGEIGTGLVVSATPSMKMDGGIWVELDFNYRYISGVSPFQPMSGCPIGLPAIHVRKVEGGYGVLLKPGVNTEILPEQGDKYSFMIQQL